MDFCRDVVPGDFPRFLGFLMLCDLCMCKRPISGLLFLFVVFDPLSKDSVLSGNHGAKALQYLPLRLQGRRGQEGRLSHHHLVKDHAHAPPVAQLGVAWRWGTPQQWAHGNTTTTNTSNEGGFQTVNEGMWSWSGAKRPTVLEGAKNQPLVQSPTFSHMLHVRRFVELRSGSSDKTMSQVDQQQDFIHLIVPNIKKQQNSFHQLVWHITLTLRCTAVTTVNSY